MPRVRPCLQDHRQFKQRYFEFLDHHHDAAGPVFLRLCGEESCDGIPNDYVAVLAKKFGAAVVTPEHRYYGKSSPFQSLATENLRFLSSKQALFDLAVFRQYYQVWSAHARTEHRCIASSRSLF